MKLDNFFFSYWLNISNVWLSERRLRSSALFWRRRNLTIVNFIIILIGTIFYWAMSWVDDKRFGFLLALIVDWLFFFLFHVWLRGSSLHLWLELIVEHLQLYVRTLIQRLIIIIDKIRVIFLTWRRFKRWGIFIIFLR